MEGEDRIRSLIITAVFAMVILGSAITHVVEQKAFKDDAVNKGVAEYYLDKDREVRWRWLADKPKVEPAQP